MKRKVVSLSLPLERGLKMYALAASAAGVGLLALAQPAEAKIVYTPSHKDVFRTFWAFDINGDGIVDFYFTAYTGPASAAFGLGLYNVKEKSNRIVGGFYRKGGFPFCSALPAGVRIGGTNPNLISWGKLLSTSFPRWSGLWANHGKGFKHRYLGLKFYVNGKAHYGWARLTTDLDEKNFAVMTGYAYETIPNKSIIAGKTKGPDVVTVQPATLGHLAAGASAIPAWRKAGANK